MKRHDYIWGMVGIVGMVASIALVAVVNRPATGEVPEVEAIGGKDIEMALVERHLRALTQWETRVTGSGGEKGARAYILDQLRGMGVSEITQQVFSVAVPVTRRSELIGEVGTGEVVRVRVSPLWPNLARTCQTPAEGLHGELLYVGRGTERELRGKRIKDALVVMDWDTDTAWLSVPEFGGRAVIFRGARPSSRTLAQRKFLTVPADIPRYYVAAEDVGMLDFLVASGRNVRVVCEVTWEAVSGANIVAKISDGHGTRGARAIDRTPVVFSAYYDSISVVPDRAPGAEQACGAAVLLELARQLRAHPGPRPVYVLFTSGHGQAFAGMTHYVEAVRCGACERPGLVVCLDLSSGADAFGVFSVGFLRPQIEMYVVPRYSTIGHKLSEVAHTVARNGKEGCGQFVDGINNTSGRGWWTYFPYVVAFESEIGTVASIPSITLATVNDDRRLVDTPDDTLAHVQLERLAQQVTSVGGRQAGLLTLARALVHWRGSFVNRALEDTWSEVRGRVMWLDEERDYTPNQPLAGAMVFLKQRQSLKYVCGTRGIPAVMTDSNGCYRISGLRRLIPIEFPPPYILEAYATANGGWLGRETNAVQRYVKACAGEAVMVADGRLLYAVDMARPDDYPWRFLPRSPEEHVNVVVFPCQSFTLLGLTDPRSYVPLADVQVLEAATKSPPYQYGVSMSDIAGADTSENVATLWTRPGLRLMVTGGIGFLGRRLILVNSTPEEPEGVGFELAELRALPSMVLQCARDMWEITRERLAKLTRYGVTNPRVSAHHEEAAGWIAAAAAALEKYDYATYRIAGERGWAAAGQAYAETLAIVNDMIHGVLFYLFLLLPLAYCLERLVVGARTIQRRVAWIGGLFALSFLVLAVVHPAFRFTLTPFLVLLAFVIITLVTTVSALVLSRVDGLLHARKLALVGLHEEHYRRAGVVARALDLGMANIRRRPQRGFLTGTSVVIVTFILLSFTSLVPTVSISRLEHPKGFATYYGLLSRNRAWQPLPETLSEMLRRTYDEMTGAVVAARAWFYSDFSGLMSVIDVHAERTGRRTTVSAILGCEPAEEKLTEISRALVAGRWFQSRDEAGIVLSRHTAARLGLSTNDIGSTVRVFSKALPLLGIVEGQEFDQIRDLDGEPLTPVNTVLQQALRAERAVAGEVGEEVTLEDYVHYSVDQVAIVPLWYALELRGAIRSVGVRLPAEVKVDEEAAGYARRSNLTILGSDGARVTLYAALSTSQLSAAWEIGIPLVLGGIMILATMMGSVYERRGEIHVYNSVGLSPGAVGLLFMAESAVYAIVGAGMGYLLGQSVAKVLHATGWLGGLSLNYSAGGTVFVTVVSMLMVLLSAIYPARQAFRAAIPETEAERMAAGVGVGETGDAICGWLPFVATPGHIYAMQAYLYEFLDGLQGVTIGQLAVDHLRAEEREFVGKPAPTLVFRAWLAPFDLSVSHDVELGILWREEHGVYQYHVSAVRYSGDRQNWRRLTPRFMNTLRKQLLLWRIQSAESQQRYEAAGRRLFKGEVAGA